MSSLLSSSQLWSALASASPDATQPALGDSQPAIRKVTWDVLRAICLRWPGQSLSSVVRSSLALVDSTDARPLVHLESLDVVRANLEVLSTTILHNCWTESDQGTLRAMWEPLLLFLTSESREANPTRPSSFADQCLSSGYAEFSECWSIEKKLDSPSMGEDDDTEDDDQDKDEDAPEDAVGSKAPTASVAFTRFLDFLANGCRGSPQQGYPILVVVLSTIPADVCPCLPSTLALSSS